MTTTRAFFVAIHLVLAATATAQVVPSPSASQPTSPSSPWSFELGLSNMLSSNIHYDDEGIDSYGLVLAGELGYESHDFALTYEMAGHSYTNSSDWDRVSHLFSADFERDLRGPLKFAIEGAVAFNGTSEDLDVVDQDLEVSPRLGYRVSRASRLSVYTRHRLKRYLEYPDDNAVKHYIGAEFTHTTAQRRFWAIEARYEANREALVRGNYNRWAYTLEHEIPLTPSDRLQAGLRYRFRRYTDRLIPIDGGEYRRVDHRWFPSITWTRAIRSNAELWVDYTYEVQYSNAPDREYRAHLLSVGVGHRWR